MGRTFGNLISLLCDLTQSAQTRYSKTKTKKTVGSGEEDRNYRIKQITVLRGKRPIFLDDFRYIYK